MDRQRRKKVRKIRTETGLSWGWRNGEAPTVPVTRDRCCISLRRLDPGLINSFSTAALQMTRGLVASKDPLIMLQFLWVRSPPHFCQILHSESHHIELQGVGQVPRLMVAQGHPLSLFRLLAETIPCGCRTRSRGSQGPPRGLPFHHVVHSMVVCFLKPAGHSLNTSSLLKDSPD